eukprot:1145049-Pelagomonas_calceolata.AAC.4
MTLALRHVIYSAILNTEAVATSMFLPTSAARVHLNNRNLTWLQNLARDILEAKWIVKNVRNDPILNARHAVMPGIGKCVELSLDMFLVQETNCQGSHILDKLKQLGIDLQRSIKLAQKLHAHSVQYAHKLTLTRRAIEIKNTQHNSGVLGPYASRYPPDPQ